MKFLLLSICLMILSIDSARSEYTKFQWSTVDLKDIRIYDMDLTPMPIIHPGKARLTFSGESNRQLRGNMKVDINIIRKLSGVALPIRWLVLNMIQYVFIWFVWFFFNFLLLFFYIFSYLAAGVYVGSCSYNDFCSVIRTLFDGFRPETCPQQLVDFGIDCRCPFKIETTSLDIQNLEINIPDANLSIVSFMTSGDYEMSFKTSDDIGSFGTIKIAFTVKPKK